jgi:uncharacterized protein YcfJ
MEEPRLDALIMIYPPPRQGPVSLRDQEATPKSRLLIKPFREQNTVPLVDRFNRVTGLIVGATLGGVAGNALGNLGLGIVIGASLGLLLGQWCRIKAETR